MCIGEIEIIILKLRNFKSKVTLAGKKNIALQYGSISVNIQGKIIRFLIQLIGFNFRNYQNEELYIFMKPVFNPD